MELTLELVRPAPLALDLVMESQPDLTLAMSGGRTATLSFLPGALANLRTGSLSATLSPVTLSAAGTVAIDGALSATLGAVTVVASGSLGDAAPIITMSSVENGSTLDVTATADVACRFFWALSPLLDDPTAAEIENGTGDVVDSGFFDYDGVGTDVFPVTFTAGLNGNYQFSVVAKVVGPPASDYSNIARTASVAVNTVAASLTLTGNRTDGILVDSGSGVLTITGNRTDGLLVESA